MKLKKIKDKVAWCLENRPATKEDDMLLIISVWKNFYKEAFCDFLHKSLTTMEVEPPQELIRKMGSDRMSDLPQAESIRRVRQKFNEEGKYLPSEKVMKQRGREVAKVQEEIREWSH